MVVHKFSDMSGEAFRVAPLPMLVLSADGIIVSANNAFCSLSQFSADDLLDKPLSELCAKIGSRSAINVKSFKRGEVALGCGGGKRVMCELTLSEFEGSNACNGILAVFQDKAETRIFEQEPRQLRKLHSLGTLAGEIAHDLNNILTGILGHVSFLRLALPQSGPHSESLAAIEDGSRRAASMTQQILRFGKEEESVYRSVKLADVVTAEVNLLRGALPKNIELKLNVDPELCVDGDEGRLTQVFMNLTVNARDALPNGGKISVDAAKVELAEAIQSAGRKLSPGEYARVKITDNGMGMSPKVKTRIFEPFFTTKDSKGTGLGLATVAQIVEEHSGAITVESEIGYGTSFEVFLPLGQQADVAESDVVEEGLPGGSERVLVVDDEEVVRTVIQRSLEHLGYRVDTATDGVDALSRYRHNPVGYDLVILDIMMPKMAGDEVFDRLRQIDTEARVLLVSGYSSDGRANSVLESGGLGFIQKPFAVEELAQEVRRCLDLDT